MRRHTRIQESSGDKRPSIDIAGNENRFPIFGPFITSTVTGNATVTNQPQLDAAAGGDGFVLLL